MASYHLSAQPVKRSEGRSVVAMAAYRSGVRLQDERRGNEADYRRRKGIAHSEIMVPDGAAEWLADRERLWNYVERMEIRRDAQLAREINMALPHELTDAERLELVRTFVRQEFVSRGMVVDFAIHKPVAEKGDDPRNFHAHLLLTMRQAEAKGLRRVKTREWNSDTMLVGWREAWAKCQNEMLHKRGHKATVDHRSLAVQKAVATERGEKLKAMVLDRSPEIHVGPKAKKAGLAGPPKSRDRMVGPKRGKPKEGKQRKLRYTELDRGSRGEENISRLGGNAQALAKRLVRTERSLARFRRRARYYERMERHYSQPPKARLFQRKNDVMDLFVSKTRHYKKRRKQVAWWVDQLDQVFRALLGLRETALVRKTVWSNRMKRWRQNDFKPSRSGGRLRHRGLLQP
jgi:ATP-dependent exoDNAse (exonuclease V) alpha subunit